MRTRKLSPKALALSIIAALVVVAAAFTVAMVAIIGKADAKPITITAFAKNKAVTVAPYVYCDVYLNGCDEEDGNLTELDVPAGLPLQLSVPTDVSKAPWRLLAVYQAKDGQTFVNPQTFEPGASSAVTVPTTQDLQLIGIEIQLPGAVTDQSGIPLAHAAWGIKTAS